MARICLSFVVVAAIALMQRSGCGYDPPPDKGVGEPCTRSRECEPALICSGGVCMEREDRPDAGRTDAGPDASALDGAVPDGGPDDAGTDAAVPDAAVLDAGPDGAMPDGSPPDSGGADGGDAAADSDAG